MPKSDSKTGSAGAGDGQSSAAGEQPKAEHAADAEEKDVRLETEEAEIQVEEPWPERFTEALKPHLSETAIAQLRALLLEGPELPFISDSGWGSRQARPEEAESEEQSELKEESKEEAVRSRGGRGRNQRGGRGRGGKRGNDGSQRAGPKRREDTRKVISDVSGTFYAMRFVIENMFHSPSNRRQRERPSISSCVNFSRENSKQRRILRDPMKKVELL